MKLYTYFRSSAAWRVRMALALKGLDWEPAPVHLRRKDQLTDAYRALNPQALVPTLIASEGAPLTQSLAIIEYLEEVYPSPPLLPADAAGRARVRALALAIACDIHPLNNLRVLRYLAGPLGQGQAARDAWYRHWVAEGLGPVEALLAGSRATGRFAHGDAPGLADLCLTPQIWNAEAAGCDLSPYPTAMRIYAAMRALPALAGTAPEAQPDAEPSRDQPSR